ncbi:EG45-like domain containing protein [Dendrobium catenatum]|uniref:EG45-like domain containing protein n=1 Tax=Dendrobium catenatum TaxID=906689 RepID=A0A2I0VSR2_9ASPA|nr:EG45-like domain containing protein [Dendrobium catenatum]
MDQKRDVIIVVAVAMLCSLSLAFAAETMASYTHSPYVPSACFGFINKGTLIAGFGNSMWNSELCGQQLKVTCIDDQNPQQYCKSSSVIVTLVDHCDECPDSITLSEEAFDVIAKKEAGNVKVKYEQ